MITLGNELRGIGPARRSASSLNLLPSLGEWDLLHAVVLGIFAATLSTLTALAAAPDDPGRSAIKADFFVSPRGNDNWSGRLADPGENDGPLATVPRARDAVRALPKPQPRGIRIVLRGGTYAGHPGSYVGEDVERR